MFSLTDMEITSKTNWVLSWLSNLTKKLCKFKTCKQLFKKNRAGYSKNVNTKSIFL